MNVLVLVVSGFVLLAALGFFVYTQKQLSMFRKSIQSVVHLDEVNSEIIALNAGAIGLGERFITLEKNMQLIATRMDELSNDMTRNSPYSYAIDLVQKLTPAENIAELCHISLAEAKLLVMMHSEAA